MTQGTMRHTLLGAMLVIFMLVVTGCATPAGPTSVQEETQDQGAYEYRIGPEDVLAISVWENENLNRKVTVRPDGMISLPLLDDVHVEGLTPEQLRDVLTKRLAEYIPNVEVSVIVAEVKSFKVSILGEVVKPARYTVQGRTTVLDAIALAGGLTRFASRKRIVVVRKQGETTQRLPFNYNRAITANGEAENFNLQPGDIILVPQTKF